MLFDIASTFMGSERQAGCTSQPMRHPVIAHGFEKLLMTNTASSGSITCRKEGACALPS